MNGKTLLQNAIEDNHGLLRYITTDEARNIEESNRFRQSVESGMSSVTLYTDYAWQGQLKEKYQYESVHSITTSAWLSGEDAITRGHIQIEYAAAKRLAMLLTASHDKDQMSKVDVLLRGFGRFFILVEKGEPHWLLNQYFNDVLPFGVNDSTMKRTQLIFPPDSLNGNTYAIATYTPTVVYSDATQHWEGDDYWVTFSFGVEPVPSTAVIRLQW